MHRAYTDGEIFYYLGRPHELKTVPGGATRAEDGEIIVASGAPEDVRRRLLYWYTAETEAILRGLLPAWAKKLSLRPRSAEVRYTKTRWGSCTSAGNLYFNSRISMMTNDIAEYIVVHELCHLRHMNHSRAFWDEMESALPGSGALRRKLREQEKSAQL